MRSELCSLLSVLDASDHAHVRAHATMLRDRYRVVLEREAAPARPHLRLVKNEPLSGGAR